MFADQISLFLKTANIPTSPSAYELELVQLHEWYLTLYNNEEHEAFFSRLKKSKSGVLF